MNQQLKMAICARMKKLRKDYNYTQNDIGRFLNMQQNSYSRMETGKTNLDIERLHDIAKLYKISISELLGGLPPPRMNRR